MARMLTVKRKGYKRKAHKRKAFTIKRKGKRIRIPATTVKRTRVPRTKYKIKDRGAPGRGKRIIKVRKGVMSRHAVKGGFIKRGQRIGDIPQTRIDDFARYLARKVGPARAQKMFRAQMIFRKRMPNGFKKKMRIAHDEITKRYERELAPRAAIRAWKRMSPRERARRMPGG